MSSAGAAEPIRTFLSCSVRPRDAAMVTELVRGTLAPHGLEAWTVGRNASTPDQVDDAVKQLLDTCWCLVGLATARMDAIDIDTAGKKTLATC